MFGHRLAHIDAQTPQIPLVHGQWRHAFGGLNMHFHASRHGHRVGGEGGIGGTKVVVAVFAHEVADAGALRFELRNGKRVTSLYESFCPSGLYQTVNRGGIAQIQHRVDARQTVCSDVIAQLRLSLSLLLKHLVVYFRIEKAVGFEQIRGYERTHYGVHAAYQHWLAAKFVQHPLCKLAVRTVILVVNAQSNQQRRAQR